MGKKINFFFFFFFFGLCILGNIPLNVMLYYLHHKFLVLIERDHEVSNFRPTIGPLMYLP